MKKWEYVLRKERERRDKSRNDLIEEKRETGKCTKANVEKRKERKRDRNGDWDTERDTERAVEKRIEVEQGEKERDT